MLPELLQNTNLFHLLHRIDIDLAAQQQKAGCPFCGSTLHYSNYQRKPRGGPPLADELCMRFSLCCSNEKCRRRTLPKSTIFMGRRVYFRAAILIITTLNQNMPQEYSKNLLSQLYEVNRRTINNWLAYFREVFPKSWIWKTVRGLIGFEVGNRNLPESLVKHYCDHCPSSESALIKCLMLLSTGLVTV